MNVISICKKKLKKKKRAFKHTLITVVKYFASNMFGALGSN